MSLMNVKKLFRIKRNLKITFKPAKNAYYIYNLVVKLSKHLIF